MHEVSSQLALDLLAHDILPAGVLTFDAVEELGLDEQRFKRLPILVTNYDAVVAVVIAAVRADLQHAGDVEEEAQRCDSAVVEAQVSRVDENSHMRVMVALVRCLATAWLYTVHRHPCASRPRRVQRHAKARA